MKDDTQKFKATYLSPITTLSMMTQLLSLAMTPIFTLLPMQHCFTVMVFSAAMSLPPSPIRLISFFSTDWKRAQGVRVVFLWRMMSLQNCIP